MTEDLSSGTLLLLVGMITVFTILFLVIFTGRVLILIVNRYFPAEQISSKFETTYKTTSETDKKIVAVLEATVNQITGGKGKIEEINKAN